MTIPHMAEPAHGARAPAPFTPPRSREGGPYGWLTPYLAAMAARSPSIASRLLSLPREEVHFIALTLALARDPACAAASLAETMGRARRAEIFAALTPGFDPRLAKLTGKLAGRVWRPASYRRLAALYAEPHARKALAHLPAVTRRAALTLARLPAPYRTRGVLRMIQRPKDLARVLFAIEIVRRVRTDLTDRQIIASLEKAESDYIRPWVERHYERLPFPAAPTGTLTVGTGGALRPAATGAELVCWGREFDNCASNYVWPALNGASALYRYDVEGRRVAFIELKPVPALGWAINELAGPKNETLEGAERTAIIAAFRQAGVHAAPQVIASHLWFDLE